MTLAEGTKAPDFSAPDQDGVIRALGEFAGGWLLLYFYPKDDTPGCTAEACGLRDRYGALKNKGVHIVGVSTDPVKSHKKFALKHELPFPLLADEDLKIVTAYGAWQEKSMYGKTYMGTVRMSYLIDPQGMIRKTYPKVKPDEHADEIVRDVESFVS